jgi:hypothetical protein
MAARLNPAHDERTRAKIQTSQLINRLFSHANGEVEMSSTQVRAAEVLLKKTLPDLQSVEIGSDPDKPMKMEFGWLKPSE